MWYCYLCNILVSCFYIIYCCLCNILISCFYIIILLLTKYSIFGFSYMLLSCVWVCLETVFCFKYCSSLLWEKSVLVLNIEAEKFQNIQNIRLLQFFKQNISLTSYWRFLWSNTLYVPIKAPIGTNNWIVETYRNKYLLGSNFEIFRFISSLVSVKTELKPVNFNFLHTT